MNVEKGLVLYGWDVFKILLDYEINRSRRYPSPVTLLEISLEPIPNSADIVSAAHEKVAGLISSHLRSADIPARFQNDYFILLPTTNEAGGRAVCERLLSLFASSFSTESGTPYTLSVLIGYTTNPGGESLSSEVFLQQANAALHQAKKQNLKSYISYHEFK